MQALQIITSHSGEAIERGAGQWNIFHWRQGGIQCVVGFILDFLQSYLYCFVGFVCQGQQCVL